MLFGVLGAAYHWDMRRILAFHIISQIGYILLGIALASEAGNAATLFYTIHHIVVKANLFLIAALIWRYTGSYDLRRIGGLYAASPLWRCCFWCLRCRWWAFRRSRVSGPSCGAAGSHRPGPHRVDGGGAGGQRAHAVFDDENLDGSVLETASR